MVILAIGAGKPRRQKIASHHYLSLRDVSGRAIVSPSLTSLSPRNSIYVSYREVQDELRERKGLDIPMTHVIITSDEQDPAWWDEVRALGWVPIDHDAMRTEQVYGKW